jgi:hypothetical protein
MQHRIILFFLLGITFVAFGAAPPTALGQEAPSVRAYANAPGWITVNWEHSGEGVYWFEVHRLDAPYNENAFILLAKSYNRTDGLTDKNLKANTVYKYRVCAVYASSWTCSDWVSARTLAPPPSSGGPSGGTSAPPKHGLRTPNLSATSNAPFSITLHWGSDSSDLYTLGNVQLYRDGQITYDAKKYGGFTADYNDGGGMYDSATKQWTGPPLRPNTEYVYRVCFIGFAEAAGQTKCSISIAAIGKPIAPTALAGVNWSKSRIPGGRLKGVSAAAITLRRVILATWRNTDIPGRFITVEREDQMPQGARGPVGPNRLERFGPAWIEIHRIPAKGDPTDDVVDITSEGPDPLVKPGNNYRVCAVVPALGDAGKVCSAPTTVP